MKRLSGAYTIMEVLVVLATIGILLCIAYPVIANARRAATKAASIEHMRQIGMSLMLYREQFETSGPSARSSVSSMGLPWTYVGLIRWAKLPSEVIHTGGDEPMPGLPAVYTWLVPENGHDVLSPSWGTYVEAEGDQAVCLVDDTQGNEVGSRFHMLTVHHLLGLHLDGHVSERHGMGNYTSYGFWSDKF